MTTCPASVDYMHLVDYGRTFVHETHKREWHDRLIRWVLTLVLPYPKMFRLSLLGAAMGQPFKKFLPARLKAMLELAPSDVAPPSQVDVPQLFKAEKEPRMRVTMLNGCAQQVLRPSINEATVRLLTRLGCEVVIAENQGCCGALVHHMGREHDGHEAAKRNIRAWEAAEVYYGRIDAVIINASGCGTTVKDYGWMLRLDDEWAERAKGNFGQNKRHQRNLVGAWIDWRGRETGFNRRVSFRMFHAAWAKTQNRADDAPERSGLHGAATGRVAHLLRVCGHIQHHATRMGGGVARPQGQQYQKAQSRCGRDG